VPCEPVSGASLSLPVVPRQGAYACDLSASSDKRAVLFYVHGVGHNAKLLKSNLITILKIVN
jgi:hypothetical protein